MLLIIYLLCICIMKTIPKIVNIFTMSFYCGGKWLYLGEAQSGRMKDKRKLRAEEKRTKKKPRHTDYRMKGDWTEDCIHASEQLMVPQIVQFVKKHRRNPTLEDVTEMFSKLQSSEPVTEPHVGDEKQVDWELLQETYMKFCSEIKDKKIIPEHVLSFVESLFSALWLLPNTRTIYDVVALLVLFVKATMQPSDSFMTMIRDFLYESLMGTVDDDEETDTGAKKMEAHNGWEGVTLLNSWRSGLSNPIFAKISFVVSFLVTAGIVKEQKFSIKGFDVFRAEAFKEHVKFGDIVDGMLSTVIFFLEKGHQCFSERSLSPLWGATSELNDFDQQVAFLVGNISNVRNGNLHMRTGISDNKYEDILEKARQKVKLLIEAAPNSTIKGIMLQKQITLTKIYSDFCDYVSSSGMREAPYCFCLFGKSSVGKSSLCTTLLTALLQINGFECTDEYIANVQDTDKYMSTYRSKVTGVVLDDMCNTRAEHADVNPTARIIEMVNNVTTYANMAEAERKGKTFIMPKVVAVTTNSPNLDAAFWSVEPVSVLRRIHVRIVVKVRPEYATDGKLDSGKVMLNYVGNPKDLVKDLWILELQRLEPIPNARAEDGAENWRWTTMEGRDNKLMKDVGIFEVLQFLGPKTRAHFEQQRALVETYTNFGTKMKVCQKCYLPCERCACCVENSSDKGVPKMDPHSGLVWAIVKNECTNQVARVFRKWHTFLWSDILGTVFPIGNEWRIISAMSDAQLFLRAQRLSLSPFIWWTQLVPDDMVKKKWFRRFYYWISRKNRMYYMRNLWCLFQLAGLTVVAHQSESPGAAARRCAAVFIPLGLFNAAVSSSVSHYRIVRELQNRRRSTDFYSQLAEQSDVLATIMRYGVYATVGLGAVTAMRAVWHQYCKITNSDPQSALNPKDEKEVNDRNAAINPWQQQASPRPMVVNTPGSYKTEQMRDVVTNGNLVYLSYTEKGGTDRWGTDAIYISSKLVLMPRHVWFIDNDLTRKPRDVLVFDIVRALETSNGGWCARNVEVHFVSGVRVGDTDMMLFSIPVGGIRTNIVKFFPDEIPHGKDIDFMASYRNKDGSILHSCGVFHPGNASYENPFGTEVTIVGGTAEYNRNTFRGMCFTTLFARHNPPFIVGFHLAGLTGTPMGSVASVTKGMLKEAFAAIKHTPGYVEAHSSGILSTTVLGKDIGFIPSISIRSPVSYIYEYNAEIYGSCAGGVKAGSKVVPSMIANELEINFGFEPKWGEPNFRAEGRRWKPWYDSLIHLVNPRHKLDPELLEAARNDYVHGFLPHFKNRALTDYIRPLTLDETVNGIDGVRFIDPLNMSTSMGFPLSGTKRDFLVEKFPEPNSEGKIVRKFLPTLGLEQEIERCEQAYLRGERCHHIFKACLKDEPTKKTKDKVRVFEAAPIVLQLLIRKYFLSLIRFVSMVPIVSECAVGINCFGTEWAELHEHVTEFGEDRIVAGDYSKWDLRLPAQLVLVAFDILIRFAHISRKYTDDQLTIMRGIATDVAYPVIAFNGTLMELHGSNPSGQNLTAHLNSICNSILLRMGFFHLTGHRSNFRQFVHAFTYGDDLISGVHKDVHEFTHVSYANFLKDMDIEFTMPDKESEPVPYMHIADVDFLKRKSVFHTELLRYVGKLDLDSINKSLMCQRQGKANEAAGAMRSTIQSALHETVLHGEEVYTWYAGVLQQATSAVGLHVPDLAIPYAQRIASWFIKYNPDIDLGFVREDVRRIIEKQKEAGSAPLAGALPDNVTLVVDEI